MIFTVILYCHDRNEVIDLWTFDDFESARNFVIFQAHSMQINTSIKISDTP